MKKMIMVALLLSASCKKEGSSTQPPPIDKGKCLVDRYVGAQAMRQGCTYVGYAWTCVYDEKTMINTCDRGAEAVGERVPVVEPAPVPAFAPPAPPPAVDAGP